VIPLLGVSALVIDVLVLFFVLRWQVAGPRNPVNIPSGPFSGPSCPPLDRPGPH
jgi:hypothetical protein